MINSASAPFEPATTSETGALHSPADPSAPSALAPKRRPVSATYRDHIPRAGCVPTPADLAAEQEAILAKERAALAERTAGNELQAYGGCSSDGFNGDFLAAVSRSLPSSAGTEIAQDAAALAMVNALGDLKPADPIEAMLLGQVISANAAALELRNRAWRDRLPERQAGLLNLADKAARTLAMLVDALARHRARGRQVVRVEHVTVHPGGQAVIGDVHSGRGREGS